jgi:beta-lactamase regulating signal transducer with metallopeptidase domain
MLQTIENILKYSSDEIVAFLGSQFFFSLILFVVIYLLTFILKKKYLVLTLGLWSFIFVRLILPPQLSAPFSGRMLIEKALSLFNRPEKELVNINDFYDANGTINIKTEEKGLPVKENITPSTVLFVLWSIGITTIFLTYLFKSRKYKILIKKSKECDDREILFIVEKWKKLFNVRRKVKLVYGSHRISPFTIGISNPAVYLPEYFIEQKDKETIESVIAHEMAHIKHVDALWIKLQNIIQFIYFFNPVVWLAGSQFHQILEQICDSQVLSKKSLSSTTYGSGLINVVELNLTSPEKILSISNFTNSKERLIQRIQNIKRINIISKSNIFVSCAVLIFTGFLLLPMANHTYSGQSPNSGNNSFISPYPDGFLALEYGKDWNPLKKEYMMHNGIDVCFYGYPFPVNSTEEGMVVFTGKDEIFSELKEIIIQHKDGFQTRYLHLDSIFIQKNQLIQKGQIIGHVPYCVHLEFYKNGVLQDPEKYITLEKRVSRKIVKE